MKAAAGRNGLIFPTSLCIGTAKLALAALLVLQPVAQAAELAPIDVLLTRTIPQDKAALATSGPEKGERLAKLQSDLSLVVEGLEGFASEEDAVPSLKRLRETVDTTEQFKNRASALNAAYRALAVVDYTWAKRLPEAPCSPETSRARLLKSSALSSWIASLLGPQAESGDAASKLDQASAATKVSAREYTLLRAKIRKTTEALASDKAVGSKRASLYCRRAEAYEALSQANSAATGLVSASRATTADDSFGVFVLARTTTEGLDILGAATAVEGSLVTDGRLAVGEGLVVLRRGGKSLIPVRVERRDGSGLALLRAEVPVKGFTLAESAPAKDDLIDAIGHPERTGAWTRTRGLVTSADLQSFQTDAVVDVGMTGGAALAEDGRLTGVFVLRSARAGGKSFDWPVAVAAPALRNWLQGAAVTPSSEPIQIAEAGSASILTASRPLDESLAPGAQATQAGYEFYDGNVHAKCVANCGDARPSSGSNYSSSGGAELGQALGQAVAPLVEALIFEGIPALFRGIGSLFKSTPKSTPSPRMAQAERKAVEKPKPSPELTVTLTPISIVEGKQAHFLLSVKSNRDDVKTSGLSVTFSVEHDKEMRTGTAVTDASGAAVLEVTPSPAARGFVDLQKESARHPELINTGRETNAERICKIVMPGSLALGMLTAAAVLAPTPQGVVVLYAGGAQCLTAATGLMVATGLFCTVEFGKQALAPQAQQIPAPSYSSPAIAPDVTRKPGSTKDATMRHAEASIGGLDDEAREHSDDAPAQTDTRNMAGGQSADPNEPPDKGGDNENKNNGTSKREELLSKAEDTELRKAVDQMYREKAKIGDGGSMDAYRYEARTGIKLSDSGHASKLIERRNQLLRILRKPGLNESDAKITKYILIDIQAALIGL